MNKYYADRLVKFFMFFLCKFDSLLEDLLTNKQKRKQLGLKLSIGANNF